VKRAMKDDSESPSPEPLSHLCLRLSPGPRATCHVVRLEAKEPLHHQGRLRDQTIDRPGRSCVFNLILRHHRVELCQAPSLSLKVALFVSRLAKVIDAAPLVGSPPSSEVLLKNPCAATHPLLPCVDDRGSPWSLYLDDNAPSVGDPRPGHLHDRGRPKRVVFH
jgi:hypothetical protein